METNYLLKRIFEGFSNASFAQASVTGMGSIEPLKTSEISIEKKLNKSINQNFNNPFGKLKFGFRFS